MPFTNVWSTTRPPGSEVAKNIDNEIRALRVDIDERMAAALFVDFAADPLVLRDEVIGKVTGKKLLIPFTNFIGGVTTLVDGGRTFDGTSKMYGGFILPVGSIMTKVEFLTERTTGTIITCNVVKNEFGAITLPQTIQTVATLNVAGKQITATPDFVEPITVGNYYHIYMTGAGGAGSLYYVHAARITYNTPDSRYTI